MTAKTDDTRAKALQLLRVPFPAENIDKLPKVNCSQCTQAGRNGGGTCQRHTKAKCKVCDSWITTGHIHLDYVGHAVATARLLDADLEWTWEPAATTAEGLPLFDDAGGLWIRLTVAGVTRLGYGSADGKTGPNAIKEAIGDGIRNAGMRFGLALDLWAKSDLHAVEREEEPQQQQEPPDRPMQRQRPQGPADDEWTNAGPAPQSKPPSPLMPPADANQLEQIAAGLTALRKCTTPDAMLAAVSAPDMANRPITNATQLTKAEAASILETLRAEAFAAQQVRKMHALFKQRGVDDHDARIAFASRVVGHAVATTSDLTADEVQQVCKALNTGEVPAAALSDGTLGSLTMRITAAQTSNELADISEAIWKAKDAGEITDAEHTRLIDLSMARQSNLPQAVAA